MTGREAIYLYLTKHKTMTAEQVARGVNVTLKAVRVAQSKMLADGVLTVINTHGHIKECAIAAGKTIAAVGVSGLSAGNSIFDECRRNWGGYHIHKLIGGAGQWKGGSNNAY